MRLTILYALMLALSTALAGCAQPATAPASPPAASLDADAPAASAGAAPNDTGLGSHTHDLWAGRERVTLLDEDIVIEAPDVAAWALTTTRFFRDPSFGGAFVDLPENALVYEGTGRVEIVATWSDPTITGLRFVHRHAGSGELSSWIATPQGETVAIEVTPEMTDMPHAQVSRWGFAFAAHGAPAVAAGTFHLRIDIVKVRDVAEWPAHPDHWSGGTELTIAQGEATSARRAGPTLLEDPWGEPEGTLRASGIVPMDAKRLRVDVTLLSQADPATAAALHLLLRDAADVAFDYDDAGAPSEVSSDGLTWTWELPIEMEQTDNPYANESAWAFRVRGGPETEPDVPFCEHGCYESEVKYALVARVAR